MGELDGKVAIMTGSTRGIGRAIAERFANEGAAVVVHGRDQATCDAIAAAIPRSVGRAGDISMPGVADELVAVAIAELGRLDIVINNAGVAIDNFVTGVTDESWERSLAPTSPDRSRCCGRPRGR